jgi:tripartite-type tricarboxylate transporter receptor subunit TctC
MLRFLRAILIFQLAGMVFSNLCLSAEDTFPSKPITVIVPFAAGGGSDVFVRIFQDSIRRNKLCPQPIVVKNISGAGGTIGSRTAREAEPDGHTDSVPPRRNLHGSTLWKRGLGTSRF